jgi:hypothetical protein
MIDFSRGSQKRIVPAVSWIGSSCAGIEGQEVLRNWV